MLHITDEEEKHKKRIEIDSINIIFDINQLKLKSLLVFDLL
jgi:hypothetical protein